MFGETCVAHGQIVQSGDCCPGLTAWQYDSKTGVAYNGFGCWWADCIPLGQYAGPGGTDLGKCCAGLVAVNGICKQPVSSGGGGITPMPPVIMPAVCAGTFVCDIPDMWIYGGGAALLLLMMMGGKK